MLELSLRHRGISLPRQARGPGKQPSFPALQLASELGRRAESRPTAAGQDAAPTRLAQSAGREPEPDGPEPPLPFAAVVPGPPPRPSVAQDRGTRLRDFTLVEGWAIPPIRWAGHTSSTYSLTTNSGGSQSLSNSNLLNLRASSYIYQPWYAQVSGGFGLGKSDTSQKGSNDSNSKSTSTSITYDGNLNLFPQSRFPLQAYVQQADSQARTKESSTEYSSTRFGMRQSYRPLVGPDTYSGSYDHSVVAGANVRSVVDAMQGAYSSHFGEHSVGASGHFSSTSGDIGGQGSELFNLSGTHNWRASELLTLSSQASLMDNQIRTFSGTGLAANHSQLAQFNSSFSWLPDKELPLTITGGGNLLNLTTETDTGDTKLANLNGFANASYRISDQLQANAGLTATQTESDAISQFSSTQNASLSYSGLPLVFGNYSYNWGAGGGVNNQIVSEGDGTNGWSGQIQHSLQRSTLFDETSMLMLTASQGGSVTSNSQSGQSSVVTHTGGALWRLAMSERASGSLSATATDTLSMGNFSSHYLNFSTQGSLQTQLSSRSVLAASLNFVYSQQIKAPQFSTFSASKQNLDGSSRLAGAGVVTYNHRNPFDVIGLYYSASFQVNMSQSNERVVTGNSNANLRQTGSVFQQNLDYRVGRLGFRATTSFAQFNGKENASVFFMVNREFGDY